jgi:hypothetical protein
VLSPRTSRRVMRGREGRKSRGRHWKRSRRAVNGVRGLVRSSLDGGNRSDGRPERGGLSFGAPGSSSLSQRIYW